MAKVILDPKNFRLADYVGYDVAITPTKLREGIRCKKDTPEEYKADAMQANVKILTGKHAGSEVVDTLLFGAAVVDILKKEMVKGDLPLACTPEWVESQNRNADGTPRSYLSLTY